MFAAAQILGFIGYSLILSGYFQKTKNNYLIVQILANSVLAVHYLFLNSFSAIVNSGVSIIRSCFVYKQDKKGKKNNFAYFWLFVLIIIVLGIITYKNIFSILPIIIAIMYTIAAWQKKLKNIYIIGVLACILWMFYNYEVKAYTALIGTTLELILGIKGIKKQNQ